jgi:hypothetical protein
VVIEITGYISLLCILKVAPGHKTKQQSLSNLYLIHRDQNIEAANQGVHVLWNWTRKGVLPRSFLDEDVVPL